MVRDAAHVARTSHNAWIWSRSVLCSTAEPWISSMLSTTCILTCCACRSCTWSTLVMCRPRSLLCQRRCGPVVLADAAWLARCTAVAMAGVGHQRLLARLGAIVLHTPPPPSRTAVMEIDRVQQEEERL